MLTAAEDEDNIHADRGEQVSCKPCVAAFVLVLHMDPATTLLGSFARRLSESLSLFFPGVTNPSPDPHNVPPFAPQINARIQCFKQPSFFGRVSVDDVSEQDRRDAGGRSGEPHCAAAHHRDGLQSWSARLELTGKSRTGAPTNCARKPYLWTKEPLVVFCRAPGKGRTGCHKLQRWACLGHRNYGLPLQLNVSSDISIEVAYYNERLAVWEPLVEPIESENRHKPWEINVQVVSGFCCEKEKRCFVLTCGREISLKLNCVLWMNNPGSDQQRLVAASTRRGRWAGAGSAADAQDVHHCGVDRSAAADHLQDVPGRAVQAGQGVRRRVQPRGGRGETRGAGISLRHEERHWQEHQTEAGRSL